MKQIKPQARDYSVSEISGMTPTSIFMLMEQKGADVFGLWSADKSDIIKSYGEQVGFRHENHEELETITQETHKRKINFHI